MSERQVNLSIIIPVFNEIDNVEILYQEIATSLSSEHCRFEVIFVDDGSTDGTGHRLEAMANDHAELRVVRHKVNTGQSAALVTGAKHARYDLLITLDGDGQNDPADIMRLVAAHHHNTTVVLGLRKKRHDNIVRKLSSRIANGVRRWLLNDDCPDTGCSLKLFPKDAFLALPHFDHFHRFLPALFKRAGFQLVNVPVNHRPRLHGFSKYGVMNRLFVGIHDLMGVRWLIRRPCTSEIDEYER